MISDLAVLFHYGLLLRFQETRHFHIRNAHFMILIYQGVTQTWHNDCTAAMDLVRVSPTSLRTQLSGDGAPGSFLENDTCRVKIKAVRKACLRPLCCQRCSFLAVGAIYGNVPVGARRRSRASDCCATNSSDEAGLHALPFQLHRKWAAFWGNSYSTFDHTSICSWETKPQPYPTKLGTRLRQKYYQRWAITLLPEVALVVT